VFVGPAAAAYHRGAPRFCARARPDRQHGTTGRAHSRDQLGIHDSERRAGLLIEQADQAHVARQMVRVIALEDVHRLERDVPSGHPREHGKSEPLVRDVDFRARRCLDLAGAQCLEACGEGRQRGTRLEEARDISRGQIADLALGRNLRA
jgi:hypothetical protein